jgi:hypothetical protein
LVYRVPGPVRSFSVTAFDSAVAPRFFLIDSRGVRTEVATRVSAYDGGKRARFEADVTSGQAAGLEIELPADAAPKLAIGRVEISWISKP